jgi:hypothetical protein
MRACGFAVTAGNVVWRGMPVIVHPLAVGLACPRAYDLGRDSDE